MNYSDVTLFDRFAADETHDNILFELLSTEGLPRSWTLWNIKKP